MKALEATICIGKFIRLLRKKRIPILQNPFQKMDKKWILPNLVYDASTILTPNSDLTRKSWTKSPHKHRYKALGN